jgi:hypothetical protein
MTFGQGSGMVGTLYVGPVGPAAHSVELMELGDADGPLTSRRDAAAAKHEEIGELIGQKFHAFPCGKRSGWRVLDPLPP